MNGPKGISEKCGRDRGWLSSFFSSLIPSRTERTESVTTHTTATMMTMTRIKTKAQSVGLLTLQAKVTLRDKTVESEQRAPYLPESCAHSCRITAFSFPFKGHLVSHSC